MEDVVKELKTGRRFKVTEEAVIVAEEKQTIKRKGSRGRRCFYQRFSKQVGRIIRNKGQSCAQG